jgi:aromatic-L-amino-acid decarboxylase
MNYSLQLGRQFRALKLWWLIKSFGMRGITDRLAAAADLADQLRKNADNTAHWNVENPSTPFPLVCLRYAPPGLTREQTDQLNRRIHHKVNSVGRSYVSHTVLERGYVIRISIGNIHTRGEDIDALWHELTTAATAATAAHEGGNTS